MAFFRNSVRSSLREAGIKKVSQPERAYESFFEGYSADQVQDTEGKLHVKRVYDGNYYAAETGGKRRIIIKALYTFCFLVGAACIACIAVFSDAELPRYAELLHAAAVILLGWQLVGLLYYLPAPENMKAHTFKLGTNSVRRSSAFLIICFGLLLVMTVILMATDGKLYLFEAGLYAAGAAASFVVFNSERKITYTEVSGTN